MWTAAKQRMLVRRWSSGALDYDDGAAHAVDAVVAHAAQEHPANRSKKVPIK